MLRDMVDQGAYRVVGHGLKIRHASPQIRFLDIVIFLVTVNGDHPPPGSLPDRRDIKLGLWCVKSIIEMNEERS